MSNKYTLTNCPRGQFYEFSANDSKRQVSASYVLSALVEDGRTPEEFHRVVDFGVSNMGRYGTQGKRLFLFVPEGANLSKVRGFN